MARNDTQTFPGKAWEHPDLVMPTIERATTVIPLRSGFALVDTADLPLVRGVAWYLHSTGYVYGMIDGRVRRMHRLISGEPDGMLIDHANGRKNDNRRSNLRAATHAQNTFNRRLSAQNRCGFMGVWTLPRGWFGAAVMSGGRRIWIGRFASAEDAAIARDEAALVHHGEFARLNFPARPALSSREASHAS